MPNRGVNPADASVVLKALLDVWDAAAERMIATVARRLAQGVMHEGWAEIKARQTLAVRDELLAIMARTDVQTPRLAAAALEEARKLGALKAAVGDNNGLMIGSRPEVVQALAERLSGRLRASTLPVVRAHTDVFQRATSDAELLMSTGTITRRDAVAQSVDRLLAQGHDRFRDESGRRWHLDSYARMAGRTMAGQIAVQGQLDEQTARGRDLVVVSDSPRECALCRPWEGTLLSITGAGLGEEHDGHHVAALVAAAIAAGLQHPNCTHRLDPFTPGLTRIDPAEANPEGYAEQQRLRQYERRARELKRRLAAAEQIGKDTPTAKQLRRQIRDNSTRIKTHATDTGQRRKTDRERPVGRAIPTQRRPITPQAAANPPRRAEVLRGDPDVLEAARAEAAARRAPDLTKLTDADLDARLTAVTEAEDFDGMDAVIGEMERRETAAANAAEREADEERAAAEAEEAQWQRFDALLDDGWDEETAVAEVFGKSVEQQRRDRAIGQMRGQGYTGRGFDELARKAFRDWIYDRYIAAENATNGHMLNATGQSAGVDPHELFVGPKARARKHASNELLLWWDNNGRPTYDEFVAGLLGDAQAAREAGFRTGGEDWLR